MAGRFDVGGRIGNNTATNLEYVAKVWPKIVETKLNSVLAAVSWAQIEPVEGKFDFSALDGVIQGARQNNLRLALLWFGSWKNGYSTYAPNWVKRDYKRFPRVQNKEGRSIEVLTPFSNENRDADARAFAALMKTRQGRRWPEAHCHHGPGGKRNIRSGSFALGGQSPRRARARSPDQLPEDPKENPDPRTFWLCGKRLV